MSDKIKLLLFPDPSNNFMTPFMNKFLDMIVVYTHILSTTLPNQKYYIAQCDYINKELKYVDLRTLLASAFFSIPCYGEFVKIINDQTYLETYINTKFGETFRKDLREFKPIDIDNEEEDEDADIPMLILNGNSVYYRYRDASCKTGELDAIINDLNIDHTEMDEQIINQSNLPFQLMTNIETIRHYEQLNCNHSCDLNNKIIDTDRRIEICGNSACGCEGCEKANKKTIGPDFTEPNTYAKFITFLQCICDFNKYKIEKEIDEALYVGTGTDKYRILCNYTKIPSGFNHAGTYLWHIDETVYGNGSMVTNHMMDQMEITLDISDDKLMITTTCQNIEVF
ncbi:MAG: hypothetical protein Edafosvirus5_9 [Edafosvirus sp.]|uniref:Uncharacterized protein n=1 Tax=Edafosvirus sp. TaxID=2487765 RepID=A0A3G4ZVS1_9VIRU|nr:MAG: hypothetical protein Edafosvirus5_9 [Edafosvirus sp.]